jgi:adenosylcobinamide-GDP ribazoletransferase
LRQLRLAFGFFTVLPLARSGDLRQVAAAGYLLPLVAVILGAGEGMAAWGLLSITGTVVSSALVLALALLLTGFHHTDGLADMGDAVMAGGGKDRRLAVLKDRTMGVGAVMALLLVYLISWAALIEDLPAFAPSSLPWVFVSVEVSARLSLITVAVISRSSHSGSGSEFLAALKGARAAAAILMSLGALAVVALLIRYRFPLACAAAAILVGMLLAGAGRRWFGGANGDLLGASVELGRMAALLAVAVAVCR